MIESLKSITDHSIEFDTNIASKRFWPAVNLTSYATKPPFRAQPVTTSDFLKEVKELLRKSQIIEEETKFASSFGFKAEEERAEDIELLEFNRKFQQLMFQTDSIHLLDQVIVLYACSQGELMDIDIDEVNIYERKLITYVRNNYPELIKQLAQSSIFVPLAPDVMITLHQAISKFHQDKGWKM